VNARTRPGGGHDRQFRLFDNHDVHDIDLRCRRADRKLGLGYVERHRFQQHDGLHDDRDTTAGTHSFTWDGTTSSGTPLEDGTYTLEVTALDDDGDAIDVDQRIKGKVASVDNE